MTRVREQLKARSGGANDARMMCAVTERPDDSMRRYRLPTRRDSQAAQDSAKQLDRLTREQISGLSVVPKERMSLNEIRRISVPLYGMTTWVTFSRLARIWSLLHCRGLLGNWGTSTRLNPPALGAAVTASR